ncbi:hypothetical protein COEREDRAFT_84549 [Coemansia reversa NRRL 1564]|uniref:HSF-type DNA-binding domain-containing protein n=1 Tax=Coemansia reversa (strain ATCC 12441 / NRRL 1564) TaxID=763665 RepID=A0A2G5BJR1_COERN|nr:hypothetical protein COEREDRAFT_84549 [Coemansia reversa NRRL 1564]|eukprot:PIA19243.1 hypothetical protein COEREDRAFT_84549 [Coemansia reversa NRRL 1564]
MSAVHLVDTTAFGRPAGEAMLCQETGHNPACSVATPASSTHSPYAAINGNPSLGSGTIAVSSTWQPVAPSMAKLSINSGVGPSDSLMQGALVGSMSTTAYPTPSQSIAQKTTTVGYPLNPGYSGHSAMFAPASFANPGGDMSKFTTAIGAALTRELPATTSHSEFATAATTPLGIRNSSNSSPLSLHNVVLNHTSVSPTGLISSAPLQPHEGMVSISSAIPPPLGIHPHSASVSRLDELAGGGLGMRGHPSLTQSEPTSASLHGTGMTHAGSNENEISSADSLGQGLATAQPASAGIRTESALFPSLLHRTCEDPAFDSIAYWDENNFVCIPVMENLRVQLNSLGMTANHTDSLQKNFNDYQFKRQTDQRRIRHTSEQGIVKFSNANFLPGREDLLHLVVRKSALKKLQGSATRERQNASTPAPRKKVKPPSMRQSGPRASRASTSERLNPYTRYMQVEAGQAPGFTMPMSPMVGTFHAQQAPGPAGIPPLYTSSEGPGLVVPFGVPPLGFSIQQHMPMPERADQMLVSSTGQNYPQPPFYIDHASSGFIPGFMQSNVSLAGPMQGRFSPSLSQPSSHPQHQSSQALPPPHQQHFLHQEHSPHELALQSNGGDANMDSYHHSHPHQFTLQPPQMQQHQYQLFAPPAGELPMQPTPPRIISGRNSPSK